LGIGFRVLRQISLTRLAVETSRTYHDIFLITSSPLTPQELLLATLVSVKEALENDSSEKRRTKKNIWCVNRRPDDSVSAEFGENPFVNKPLSGGEYPPP